MRTKLPNSYRVQPDHACCRNCTHACDHGAIGLFCNFGKTRPKNPSLAVLIPWEASHEVTPLGICDHYEAKAGH